MRIKGTVVLAVLAAAAVTVGLGPTASAAERHAAAQNNRDGHVVVLAPTTDKKARNAGGGRSHDFTGDGIPDILARSTSGALKVYPNSGTFNGTATYPTSTVINTGWGSFNWVGSADLNGDGFSDVVATDWNGNLYGALHSGQFNGTSTLVPGLVLLGTGWNINDRPYVYDYNGDGFDDLLARRWSMSESYVYFNNGGVTGQSTFQAPVRFMTGGYFDSYQNIADVTLDGSPDFVYIQDGRMYALPLNGGQGAELGYGWGSVDSPVFTDADNDGREDILAMRWLDNTLLAYRHSGSFTPSNGKAYSTFRAPVVVGTNWQVNDIIS